MVRERSKQDCAISLLYQQPLIHWCTSYVAIHDIPQHHHLITSCIRIHLVALRYKLRMFGVPVEGPANVFCDNRGVVKNASIPESTLAKKHNAINYHAIWEAAAAGILQVGKEDGQTNLADLLTKVLTSERRWEICWNIMWWAKVNFFRLASTEFTSRVG